MSHEHLFHLRRLNRDGRDHRYILVDSWLVEQLLEVQRLTEHQQGIKVEFGSTDTTDGEANAAACVGMQLATDT